MPDIAYVNGKFGDLADAVIPIEDRGFQFADGVYEVIVAHERRPFLLDDHLARLEQSADGIDLPLGGIVGDLPSIINEGIRRCGYTDITIYVQITRGVASREHAYPSDMTPSIVLTFKRKPVCDSSLRVGGVELTTTTDIRWSLCSIKSIALLANVMIKNDARKRGFYDAIVLSEENDVLETSCANLFAVCDGVLRTPPADGRILHGMTRGFILDVARKERIPHEERAISLDALIAAEEAFITSTSIDILPVKCVDGHKIGTGVPGSTTRRLLSHFPASVLAEEQTPCANPQSP